MRLIFEEDFHESFHEIILNEKEIEKIKEGEGISEVFLSEFSLPKILNIFIRKGDEYGSEKNYRS